MILNGFGEPLKMEVPYNFSIKLLEELKKPFYRDVVDFVYLPPFRGDDFGTRNKFVLGMKDRDSGDSLFPTTWEDYCWHVQKLKKTGIQVCLLVQNLLEPIDSEFLDRYAGLDFDVFTVCRWDAAVLIRERFPNVRIVSSITRKLSLAEFISGENVGKPFDQYVLFFPFCKDLESIKEVHSLGYRCSILVNSICSYDCEAHIHWYSGVIGNSDSLCMNSGISKYKNSIAIGKDFVKFAPYLTSIKLEGRHQSADVIIDNLRRYAHMLTFGSVADNSLGGSSNCVVMSRYLHPTKVAYDKYNGLHPTNGWASWNFENE